MKPAKLGRYAIETNAPSRGCAGHQRSPGIVGCPSSFDHLAEADDCVRFAKRIRQIEKRTLDAMQQYSWPGNIRELQNVIERGVILGAIRRAINCDISWHAACHV